MDGSKSASEKPARTARRGVNSASASGGGPAEMGKALETMRILATLVVVFYHAALTYVATPLRLTVWVAFETSGHVAFDVFIYWVNAFAMPVFFLAAGVSAPAGCDSRGPRVFLTHRVKRLLRPLLFASLTILPVFYLLWGYGLMATGRCDLDSIQSWRFSPELRHNLYGLGHLWFLEYLFVVCVLWCGAWCLRNRVFKKAPSDPNATGDGWHTRLLASAYSPFLLAIPTLAIFLIDSDTMIRVDNVIVPNVFRVLHYWFFFAVGGWISKVREPRRRFAQLGPYFLSLSFVVYAFMVPLLLQHAQSPLQGDRRIVFCVLAAMFPWLLVLGSLGVLLRLDTAKGPIMRFLSESSFWLYLIHVPIVAFLQVLLLPVAWPSAIKFLIVGVVGLGVSLASYSLCVRYSIIGEIINGARKRLPKTARLNPELGWIMAAGAVLLMFGGAAWWSNDFLFRNNIHEEVPGQIYRSARLKPKELDDVIRREGIKSVITFTGGGEKHPWFLGQKKICAERNVQIRSMPLRQGGAPSRTTLINLIDHLSRAPRPVLVQGYRGRDEVALGAAMALMLDGESPSKAQNQFAMRYGQFSGAEHSGCGRILLQYRDWLQSQGLAHSPERLQEWARGTYQQPDGQGERSSRMVRATQGKAIH